MPSQVEEVRLQPHRPDAQQLGAQKLGEDARDPLLGRRARDSAGAPRPIRLQEGERLAVDLAVGGQGEGRQGDPGGRHHELGQPLAQEIAQLGRLRRAGRGRRVRRGHHVRHQPVPPGLLPLRQHHRAAQPRVGRQGRLDLSRLDPEAPHLDLRVDPAEELEVSRPAPAHQVAGPVQAPARLPPLRVRQEALRRPVRMIQIAARQAVPSRAQLSGDSRRHRHLIAVQDRDPGVGDRASHRHRGVQLRRGTHRVAGGEARVLGRPVAVDQAGFGELGEHPAGVRHRQHVATDQQLAHSGERPQILLHHLPEQPGGQPQRGHPLSLHHLAQLGGRQHTGRRDHQAGAVEERPPQLQRRGVERIGGVQEQGLVGAEPGIAGPPHEPHHSPVRHRDPLRLARRARGVHHVGQACGSHRGQGRFPPLLLPRRPRRRAVQTEHRRLHVRQLRQHSDNIGSQRSSVTSTGAALLRSRKASRSRG